MRNRLYGILFLSLLSGSMLVNSHAEDLLDVISRFDKNESGELEASELESLIAERIRFRVGEHCL